MFSFTNGQMVTTGPDYKSEKVSQAIALVITKSSTEQLINDMLICAKQQKITRVVSSRFGLKENLFKTLSCTWKDNVISITINILRLMITIIVCLVCTIARRYSCSCTDFTSNLHFAYMLH